MNARAFQHYITNIGLSHISDPLERYSVALTNRIAFITLPVILSIVLILGSRQWNNEPLFVLCASAFFVLIPVLNAKGLSEASRLVLCFLLPILVLGISIISKTLPDEEITNSEYFDFRYVLITCSVVPPIVFNFRRQLLLFAGVMPFLLSLVFFDEIHDYFGVGFYQINHDIDSYPTTTWVSSLMFIVLAMVLLMLRWSSDSLQIENAELIASLQKAKERLKNQNKEIKNAHEQIKSQNDLLNQKNEMLSERIQLANKELQESNDELIKHNNELKQFSHAVSHNLRAPVAKILGISELVKIVPEEQQEEYLDHMNKSAKLLDSIIRDLSTILDIRRDIFRVRRKIQFQELFDEIFFSYENEIKKNKVSLETDFKVKSIYTIKPFLVSILDNLFSNALKYYSKKRQPVIKISTSRRKNYTIISVWDNGIGIDLEAHLDKLFKLYNRFNTQTEGKGIGLYLVMKQAESLEGRISVDSEVDAFTKFTIKIPDFVNVEHQPLLEEDFVTATFNAINNCIFLTWKRPVETEELKDAMERVYDSLQALEPKCFLVDIRRRGELPDSARLWMLQEFFPKLFKKGLKKLGVIHEGDLDQTTAAYHEKNVDVFGKHGIEVKFTKDAGELNGWVS